MGIVYVQDGKARNNIFEVWENAFRNGEDATRGNAKRVRVKATVSANVFGYK